MNVGIIGSGGREHAICYMLNKSKKVSKIFCFPGNAGTGLIAENVNLDLMASSDLSILRVLVLAFKLISHKLIFPSNFASIEKTSDRKI